MKKHLLTLLALLCFAVSSNAQYTVKGYVVDTLNNTPLRMASVILVRASDSIIETFTRSGGDGHAQLNVSKPGKYIIKATYRGFADYVDVLNITQPVTDLNVIPMLSKERLLKEFVITRQIAAIKIKGDTTEYIADSFKTKENANVEDLLKKLPGIQVDKNGQITAQGETVAKILVDGEEFFSDDPKVVTKGLQAKAVDKVQVFDKKSDQAEFTGIDDGQKTKTINLELKEEYKKGYFGKVDAGGGTDGYFQNQAMLNAFKSKRQFSAFGIASNTDKVGLGWQDNDKFGSGNGVTEISEDGGIMTTYTSGDEDFSGWGGRYNGEGLPKTWTAGAHYADKWNDAKEHLSTNYRYAKQNVELNGQNITQTGKSGDTALINDEVKRQFSTGTRHALDGMFEWKADTNTTIKLTANGGLKNSETYSNYLTKNSFRIGDGYDTLSTNNRTITSNADAKFINADLLLRKKFAKKGRTLSVDLKENYKENNSEGHLTSVTTGFNTNTIDQKKDNSTTTMAFSGKATYTEPLSKEIYLEADYGATLNNSTSKIFSYDKPAGGTGDYTVLNDTFSTNYKYNIFINTGGLNLKFVYKKVNFSFGGDVQNARFMQTDVLHGDTSHTYNYLNLFPKANFSYKIGKQTSLNFNYNGSTEQPTINQIQPLRQNSDPQNIRIGNPYLKQEFNHNFSLRFNDYKVLSSRYIWTGLNFNTTNNSISSADSIVGPVRYSKYINIDGNYSGSGYGGFGFRLKKLNVDVGVQLNGSVNHVNNYINGVKNTSNYSSIFIGPYFQYNKDKIEVSWNPELSYNMNKSTLNTIATNYKVFSNSLSANVELPKKFEINSSVDIMIREKTPVFTTNNNVVKWNAYIAKKLLKKDQLQIRLSVFDILNQNIGFSRDAQANIITQNSYNTIRRYGMLNLIWNFTKTPSGNTPPAGQTIIINQ